MLAKNWKRIGLIILIVACFANITSKFVKSVSFNDNIKSTVSNVINTVDGTIQNVVGGGEQNQTGVENNANTNAPANTNVVSQPITTTPIQNQVTEQNTNVQSNMLTDQNTVVVQEVTNTVQ